MKNYFLQVLSGALPIFIQCDPFANNALFLIFYKTSLHLTSSLRESCVSLTSLNFGGIVCVLNCNSSCNCHTSCNSSLKSRCHLRLNLLLQRISYVHVIQSFQDLIHFFSCFAQAIREHIHSINVVGYARHQSKQNELANTFLEEEKDKECAQQQHDNKTKQITFRGAMTPVNQEDYFIKRRVLEDVFGKMGFGRKGGGRGGGFLSLATTSNY